MATSGSITCHLLDDFFQLSNGGLQYYLNNVDCQRQEQMKLQQLEHYLLMDRRLNVLSNCCTLGTLKSHYDNLLSFFGIEEDPVLSLNCVDYIKSWENTKTEQIFTYFLQIKAFKSEYIG